MKHLQHFQQFQQVSPKGTSDSTLLTVLAIDPGYGRCGWAILEKTDNQKLVTDNRQLTTDNRLIACDLIETSGKKSIPDRLKELYDATEYLIKKYKPQELAIESLFWFKNQKTVMGVSQARGVIIVCARNHNLSVSEYTPLQVKQAVVGYGKATKNQIQKMIGLHLPHQHVAKQDDTADAIAIGLTHLQTNKYLNH